MATADDDRDALSWEGDDIVDRSPVPDVDETVAETVASVSTVAVPASSPSKLLAGALFVLALAAMVGWVIIVVQNPTDVPSLFATIMYQLGEFVAIIAPPLWWFVAGKIANRVVTWRLVGLVLTAPWPLLVSTVLGAA